MHCIHGQTINLLNSCLSLDSYIKPQLGCGHCDACRSCLSLDSYIKPQLPQSFVRLYYVVYLLIPTSNHNMVTLLSGIVMVVYLLIPTSNHNV